MEYVRKSKTINKVRDPSLPAMSVDIPDDAICISLVWNHDMASNTVQWLEPYVEEAKPHNEDRKNKGITL